MRTIHDLTMIAVGVILLAPGCLMQIHFYSLYYGFKAKHLGIEHGRVGTVVSTVAYLFAAWGITVVSTVAYLFAAWGIGMVAFSCQDLLVLWGVLDRARLWFSELIFAGLVAALVMDVVIWKIWQRRFLAFMEQAEPRCEKCQYILTGLKPVKKTLRCPECGHIESVASVQDRFRLDLKVADHDRRGEY